MFGAELLQVKPDVDHFPGYGRMRFGILFDVISVSFYCVHAENHPSYNVFKHYTTTKKRRKCQFSKPILAD